MSYVGRRSCVLESTMKLLEEILASADEPSSGFTRAKIDMGLLGWTVMYLCLCLDGVAHSILIYNSSEKSDTKKLKGSNKNGRDQIVKNRNKETKSAYQFFITICFVQ